MDEQYELEQNKIASSGAWVWLLEVATTGQSTLRYVNNNDDVVWGGNTYTKLPFTLDDLVVETSGKFPEFKLQVGDVDTGSTLRTRVRTLGGLVGSTVRLLVVHSGHLSLTTAAIDETSEVLRTAVAEAGVTFTLGIPSLLNRRFPCDRYVPGFCRHKYKGALCGYVGALESCEHTLDACQDHTNTPNYGGSPGVVGGVYA